MKILITGGASGLGESITRCLASEPGYSVWFTYHNSELNADKIIKQHPNTYSIKCDFRSKEDLRTLQELVDSLDIDVLINNAYTGSFIQSYFHKTPGEQYHAGFTDNILPTIEITQTVINNFRKKKAGKIITILSSVLVENPPIGSSVYVASKAYLGALAKLWAIENVKFNISSNTISPSFMQTKFTKDIDERLVEQIKEQNPSRKLLTTQEVADSVLGLIKGTVQVNGIDLAINPGTDVV